MKHNTIAKMTRMRKNYISFILIIFIVLSGFISDQNSTVYAYTG